MDTTAMASYKNEVNKKKKDKENRDINANAIMKNLQGSLKNMHKKEMKKLSE